jgi:hypothetical protein
MRCSERRDLWSFPVGLQDSPIALPPAFPELVLVRQKTMSRFESITIREVEASDLETFYEHQLDPEAIRIAAFVCEDPKDKVAFDAHWDKF